MKSRIKAVSLQELPSLSYNWSQMRHLGGLIRQASPVVTLPDLKISILSFIPILIPKNCPYFEHVHAFYEAWFFLSGEGQWQSGTRQKLIPGTVVIVPPMTPHCMFTLESTCDLIEVRFTTSTAIPTHTPPQWPVSSEIMWQMASLLKEAEDGLPGWRTRVNAILTVILSKTLLMLDWPEKEETAVEEFLPQEIDQSSKFMSKAKQFLHENLEYPLTLDDIARAVGTSRRTLTRNFRQDSGCSVMDYLCRIRIEAAKKRLGETNDSVSAISASVGLPDASSFCRIFRLSTGMTPQQYRRVLNRAE